MKKKFLRRDAKRFSKFGKGKGKKSSWRKPKGRDNKMREKKKGYPSIVSIGYKSPKKIRKEKSIEMKINNMNDLIKIGDNKIGILGKVGKKKKIEIMKKAKELKIELKNFNVNSFLKKNEKEKNKLKKSEKNNSDLGKKNDTK